MGRFEKLARILLSKGAKLCTPDWMRHSELALLIDDGYWNLDAGSDLLELLKLNSDASAHAEAATPLTGFSPESYRSLLDKRSRVCTCSMKWATEIQVFTVHLQ
jgi:hypothetical protein